MQAHVENHSKNNEWTKQKYSAAKYQEMFNGKYLLIDPNIKLTTVQHKTQVPRALRFENND